MPGSRMAVMLFRHWVPHVAKVTQIQQHTNNVYGS